MSGVRGRMVTNPGAGFELAVRLREQGAPLGDVFAFISGLYFRGKSAYATAFAAPPPGLPGALIITAGRGLVTPETRIGVADCSKLAGIFHRADRPRYRDPFERDAANLHRSLPPNCEVVLLGSIATPKYAEPLMNVFGSRLLFPAEFVGRGDMSRGGLMLRCARDRTELDYIPASNAVRRGPRPPKLEPCSWRKSSLIRKRDRSSCLPA